MKKTFRVKKAIVMFTCTLLLVSMAVNFTGCIKGKAENLMEGVNSSKISGKAADDRFIGTYTNFAVELFKKTNNEKENTLISPLSILLALSMTANGANGETKSQMEKAIFDNVSIDEMNEYLYSYVNQLPSKDGSKISIANSIWFRNDDQKLKVENDFLSKNADYYNASLYKAPFNVDTLNDINTWVESKTDGMIDSILGKIDEDAQMYLINALAFDAEWNEVYEEKDIIDKSFRCVDGSKRVVQMMLSEETSYIKTSTVEGFIKPYKNDSYSFVALLPKGTIGIKDYIASLTGAEFNNAVKCAQYCTLDAFLPKFKSDSSINLNDALKSLGMTDAFKESSADFSKLGKSAVGNLFISDVFHKTCFEVNENGTKAGAATKVEVEARCDRPFILLDRPFVYAIIDNSTKLPIFIGAVMNV